MNASAPFTNDRYEEEAYAEADGVELSRVHISRTFTGDLEGEEGGGESSAELMISKSEGGGGYVGHDRISGTLGGKTGTFVFQHTGIMGPEGITNTGTILPGTGTGELEGIAGEGTMLADEAGNHTLTLAYDL